MRKPSQRTPENLKIMDDLMDQAAALDREGAVGEHPPTEAQKRDTVFSKILKLKT